MGLILLVAVIVAAWLFFRPQGFRYHPTMNNGAEEILKKRFAGGEIDEETYLKMLKNLRS